MQTTHDNHFVPQWYLRQWSNRAGRVWRRRLLVPHKSVPEWEHCAVRGIAYQRDLYTSVAGGVESDEIERWFTQEFEAPAQVALDRVLRDQTLQPHHWQHLGRYALCQQLRTPQDFAESMERWDGMMSGVLEPVLRSTVETLEDCSRRGVPLPKRDLPPRDFLSDAFKITVRPDARPETDEGEIEVSILLGREFWLRQQRHLLDRFGDLVALHQWAIAEPADGAVWFTSDQPVMRLNCTENGFDLGGGWGRQKGNVCMPLSPRHMLFTQIGDESPPRFKFNRAQTELLLRALVQRAHRTIFADRQLGFVQNLRPRTVDLGSFTREQEIWKTWHQQQVEAQRLHEMDG